MVVSPGFPPDGSRNNNTQNSRISKEASSISSDHLRKYLALAAWGSWQSLQSKASLGHPCA